MSGGTNERVTRRPRPAARLRAEHAASYVEGKRVSWVELFYDLVLVFAITKVTHELSDDVTWFGLLDAWVVFTPFWWSWVGAGILSNLTDLDHPLRRVRLFGMILITSMMTIAVPMALDGDGLLFAVLYLLLRLLLLWWAVDGFGALRLNPFSISAVFTAPMLVATSMLSTPHQRIAWTALMSVELSTTWLLRKRLSHIRVDVSHLPERFGLVVILALGMALADSAESIPNKFTTWHAAGLVSVFLLVTGMWWIYFDITHGAISHRLRTENDHSRVVRELLAYGHYALFACICAVAVGIRLILADPRSPAEPASAVLLCAGTGLYLAAFVWSRWGLPRSLSWIRFAGAAAVVPTGFLLHRQSGLALMSGLAVLVCVAAGIEFVMLRAEDELETPQEGGPVLEPAPLDGSRLG
ncbi:low temperature requirement protein A [Actinacidiphila bryophytorum]|uniref:Low temperature requirement protein A n=1 Tax=Actinacidiphila bryophytorum TaxID=1436133 RepID=A0A9W4MHU6_9ACTN|nr:low temperature requirement protein A [Actinacidiphila bryophytorum]MBM9437848.1 low temperature requirement protein A [Actinacidiphila bryophytorum]MBN6542366.1 low temperature requirement protein A [Actinacidiphila bryophytorum]CAG7657171.1 conserved membrane hypothetical protein [Actinacidiphila bryophytorum]